MIPLEKAIILLWEARIPRLEDNMSSSDYLNMTAFWDIDHKIFLKKFKNLSIPKEVRMLALEEYKKTESEDWLNQMQKRRLRQITLQPNGSWFLSENDILEIQSNRNFGKLIETLKVIYKDPDTYGLKKKDFCIFLKHFLLELKLSLAPVQNIQLNLDKEFSEKDNIIEKLGIYFDFFNDFQKKYISL